MIDAAISELEAAFSLNYNDSDCHSILVHLYVKKNRFADSMRHFQAAVLTDPLSPKNEKILE
jgi:Tfp pilus assembly protein PilF